MSSLIEIEVDIVEPWAVSFSKLLGEIRLGENYSWSLLDIEACGDIGEGKSIVELGESLEEASEGFIMTWPELTEFSKKIDQAYWMTLVGSKNSDHFKYETEKELFENYEIVISMFDGYRWIVYSKSDDLIRHLQKVFKNTKVYKKPEKTYPVPFYLNR